LVCQLIEKHLNFSDTIFGRNSRGVLAERLKEILQDEYQTPEIQLGYPRYHLLEMILDEQHSH
jgi:pyrimidine operon attenuation protein/uracil phosphoribosyltransferase